LLNLATTDRKVVRLADAITSAIQQLKDASIDNPPLDARFLIMHALGFDRTQLLVQSERLLTEDEVSRIQALINRRVTHEPVARIMGEREFWGLAFGLNEATLDPRPDSETLIEMALKPIINRDESLRLLDLGTGTGCLLLALLHELSNATGLGIDTAPRAIEQAETNAKRLGLEKRAAFRVNNWLENIDEVFDLIISNPPYIAQKDIPTLMPEVREYDPALALNGGEDGLIAYRHLIPQLPRYLKANGRVVFEVGKDQAEPIAALLKRNEFKDITSRHDLGGIERCITATIDKPCYDA